MLAGHFNQDLQQSLAWWFQVLLVIQAPSAPQAANCEIDKGVSCLDGFVASEHLTPKVAGQLVYIGSTADGILRAGHAPVALQMKTALAGRLREAMREYNSVPRRVSVHSFPAQQQKDVVQRIALTLSDETLSASQTGVELSSIAEALATEKEGWLGREETNPMATPRHRRHPGRMRGPSWSSAKSRTLSGTETGKRSAWRNPRWTIGKGNGGTERTGSWLDDTASLRKTPRRSCMLQPKQSWLTRTAAVAAVQTESGEVMVVK